VAKCVLDCFEHWGIKKLSDFKERPEFKVYNTSTSGAIALALGNGPGIFQSEYFDDTEPGQSRAGILCQDLQALTFEDGFLDLVISEDVF
jgi:hypothetical protein